MTNWGTLAILALPKMPERQLRFLLALETVTRGEGGWRTIETGVLAGQAGLAVSTVVKARTELDASGRIEYRRGTGRGHPGAYQVRVDVDKPTTNAGRVKPTSDAARVKPTSDSDRVNPGNPTDPASGTLPTGSRNPTTPNAVTSEDAGIALEPSALESSALAARDPRNLLAGMDAEEGLAEFIITTLEDRGVPDLTEYLLEIIGQGDEAVRKLLDGARREARRQGQGPAGLIILNAFPDATDDEIETLIEDVKANGARSAAAVLASKAREGTLRLPCDDGPGGHSTACRDGDPGRCGMDWCVCRCHLEPKAGS